MRRRVACVLKHLRVGGGGSRDVLVLPGPQQRRTARALIQTAGRIDAIFIPHRILSRQQRRPRRRSSWLHVAVGENETFPIHSKERRRFVKIASVPQVHAAAVGVRPAQVIYVKNDHIQIRGH